MLRLLLLSKLPRTLSEHREKMADNRDSARKGKAIEHLVAATCILASDLKLNVSTNLVDDEGVDLIFHRREDTTTLAVQVKGRLLTANTIEKRNRFRQNVRAATFRARPGLAVLFVAVNARDGTFPLAWLIPSKEFRREFAAPNNQGRYVFAASMKDDSQDRWRKYRCERAELAGLILTALDTLSGSRK